MQRVAVRCWKHATWCRNGEIVGVFFTIPSGFHEARRLFIHPSCGAVFAVDPEAEYYQGKDFQRLTHEIQCPECGRLLNDVLPHPEYFWCPSTGEIEHQIVDPDEAPRGRAESLVEFWDPLT